MRREKVVCDGYCNFVLPEPTEDCPPTERTNIIISSDQELSLAGWKMAPRSILFNNKSGILCPACADKYEQEDAERYGDLISWSF
jgi:hypothetical protein